MVSDPKRRKATHRVAITAMVLLAVADSFAAPSKASTLFGGVAHSEVVPPVHTRYPTASLREEAPKLGTIEQRTESAPSRRSVQNPLVIWTPIPKWMAGKWAKQGDLTVSYTDLRTGVTKPMNEWTQDVATITWGNQIDGAGNIWQAYLIPWERDSTSNGKSVKFIMIELKREVTGSEQVVSRVHSIVTESLGAQIVDAFQQESLNDYFLLPTGELENHSSNRDFTDGGQPIREGVLVSRFTKVGPFEPIPTLKGVDLLRSLNDYLKAHNMTHLVRSGP